MVSLGQLLTQTGQQSTGFGQLLTLSGQLLTGLGQQLTQCDHPLPGSAQQDLRRAHMTNKKLIFDKILTKYFPN